MITGAAARRVTVALAVGSLLAAAGCAKDDDERAASDSAGAGADAVPGVEHVHGLGIDPADDSLYVATHFGTFRVPDEGRAVRIGESYQDTMGFTVAAPGRFLGSGHPDVAGMRTGQPGLLGLIESTDGGASWQSLSLSGDVDFHALAFAHDRVYGWDSTGGRFMVSDDMETWATRATVDLFAFAVDPDDPSHIVGASPEGLLQSTDDGATWSPLEGPPVVTLSWDDAAGLWGITDDGSSYRSEDGGAAWEPAGRLPGQPQALLATAESLWAAAVDEERTGIYRSDDDGATWVLRYRDPER